MSIETHTKTELAKVAVESKLSQVTDRDLAISTIQRLPEDVSLEEVTDEIALISALREGVREADDGKKRSHEDVKEMLDSWLSR